MLASLGIGNPLLWTRESETCPPSRASDFLWPAKRRSPAATACTATGASSPPPAAHEPTGRSRQRRMPRTRQRALSPSGEGAEVLIQRDSARAAHWPSPREANSQILVERGVMGSLTRVQASIEVEPSLRFPGVDGDGVPSASSMPHPDKRAALGTLTVKSLGGLGYTFELERSGSAHKDDLGFGTL